MVKPTLDDMLKAGVHFGHKTAKRHPKMEPYIFAARDGVHIIDLQKTEEKLNAALSFVEELSKQGKMIMFVGTKKQVKKLVREAAEQARVPYVCERWLGGTFTNYQTISKRVSKLKQLEEEQAKDGFAKYTKKEKLLKEREIKKLKNLMEGIKNMGRIPEAIFIVDIKNEKNALAEAKKKGVKVIAITDTNVNPELVDYPIPANDDAIGSVQLILKALADTISDHAPSAKQPSVKGTTENK